MVTTHWQENCKKSQLTVFRSSISCFFEMFSQVSHMYLGDRVKVLNLKSFMMDLAGIVAEIQRESCVLYRKTTHFASKYAYCGGRHSPSM